MVALNLFRRKEGGGLFKNQRWTLSSISEVFFSTPRISSIKIAFQIIFYLKSGLNHHPTIKKQKKTWVLNSLSPTPRRQECKSTSGRVPLRGVLLHSPLRGVTRVRASMFYCFFFNFAPKITKNGSGTNDFQIEDIAKIIPMLRGLLLDFGHLSYLCTLQFLLFETPLAAPPKCIFYLK